MVIDVANLCMSGLEKLKAVLLSNVNAALAEISVRDGERWS